MKPYYQDSAVTLYHGDCKEIVPQLGKFDLLLTDPPYELQAKGGGIATSRKYLSDIDGHIDGGFDMDLLDLFDNWVVFCSKKQLVRLMQKAETKVWALVTWNKPNPTPLCCGNYLPDTEYIVHAYKSGRLFGEYQDKSRFIVHPVEKTGFNHPSVKPIAVVSKMIRLGTQINETILDPFAGTGTTGRSAKDLGRKCTLIEREEKYCEIIVKRMQQEVLDLQ